MIPKQSKKQLKWRFLLFVACSIQEIVTRFYPLVIPNILNKTTTATTTKLKIGRDYSRSVIAIKHVERGTSHFSGLADNDAPSGFSEHFLHVPA